MARDRKYKVPGAGETLEFPAGSTVSGVLIQDADYRITCDVDCWVDWDDGAGGMTGGGPTAMLMQADSVEYIHTTANQYVMHSMGVTTSGLLNYIHMEDE